MKTNDKIRIFETIRRVNNWDRYTGNFRCAVTSSVGDVYFDLPGRGGRRTKYAAKQIVMLWEEGLTAGEIAKLTGCPCR